MPHFFPTVPNDTVLVQQNPNRWALLFGCTSASSVFVAPAQDPTGSMGFFLSQNTPYLEFDFRKFGALVQLPWYVTQPAPGTGCLLMVIEVIYTPQGR